jgi:hypothetical protein
MFRSSRLLLATTLVFAALGARAAGVVEVNFVEPSKFSDAGPTPTDIDTTVRTLGDHLKRLGRALPDGQTLHVDVLDVRLAGNVRLGPHRDVRVLRGGADWPQIRLRYTLVVDGRTLRAGEDRLADMDYLFMPLHNGEDGKLPYERRLLTAWFNGHFSPAAQAQ